MTSSRRRAASTGRRRATTSSCVPAAAEGSGTTTGRAAAGGRADHPRPLAARRRLGLLRRHDPHLRRRRTAPEVVRDHEIALESLGRAREAVRPGVLGRDLHALACEPFEAAGIPTQRTKAPGERLSEGFYFGLGHGVGLEVHEAPALGRSGRDPLVAGDVVALEPGALHPNFGRRASRTSSSSPRTVARHSRTTRTGSRSECPPPELGSDPSVHTNSVHSAHAADRCSSS